MEDIDTSLDQEGAIFTANQVNADYQWLNCDMSFAALENQTSQSLTVTSNGSYAAELTYNSCVDTTECVEIMNVGLSNSSQNKILVYPNPTEEQITIDIGRTVAFARIHMYNILGKKVIDRYYNDANMITLSIPGSPGIYILKITTPEMRFNYKLTKK